MHRHIMCTNVLDAHLVTLMTMKEPEKHRHIMCTYVLDAYLLTQHRRNLKKK